MELLGWLATALFAVSYACRRPERLRLVQAGAAGLWIAYGVGIGAAPVIVANAVVAILALLSVWRLSAAAAPGPAAAPDAARSG
jgi:hypothetical protein